MKLFRSLCALLMLVCLFSVSAFAQDNAASAGDTTKTHDYARPAGKSTDKKLSTGWTVGKGARTTHVKDSYRHTKSGEVVHVHSYYRSKH